MIQWENFESKFGSWAGSIQPFFNKLVPIYAKLKEDGTRGKRILPESNNTFKCFEKTSLDNLKVVVLGMCPYHTISKKKVVADGLALSCSNTMECQPSLIQWYDALSNEYSMEIQYEPDLTYLAEQGVLLLNMALTTELYKAGNHLDLWKPFIKELFEQVISLTGVPIIMLGKEAGYAKKWLYPFQWGFNPSHPASASRSGQTWNSEGAFMKVNKILKDNNNEEISWYIPGKKF